MKRREEGRVCVGIDGKKCVVGEKVERVGVEEGKGGREGDEVDVGGR